MPRKSIIQDISFLSDDRILKGTLHLPAVNQPPVVIGSHGLHSSGNSPKQIALADQCNRFGIGYFRFDHRGCGSSQGEPDEIMSLKARCKDLTEAAGFIRSRSDTVDRIGLFGSSMGGAVCLCVASELGVSAIVTFAAPIRNDDLEYEISNQSNTVGIHFDGRKHRLDITDKLKKIYGILIFHGESDDVIPVSHAKEIYKLAKNPKKLILQKHGDHRMSRKDHQDTFIREASQWFQSRLIGE